MFAPIPDGSHQAIRVRGAALSLRNGSTVSARVLERLGPGRFVLSISGNRIPVDSRLPLVPGQRLALHVQADRGTVFLRLSGQQTSPITTYLRSEGLPQDRLGHAIVQGFMRTGLALNPASIQNARRVLGQRGESDSRLIRMYAIARDKGIELNAEQLDELALLLDGEARRDGGRREPRGRPRREGAAPEDNEGASDTAPESGTAPAAALALFNQLRGSSSHWVILPIAFVEADRRLSGSLRLLLEPESNLPRLVCCAVESGELSLDVAVTPGSRTAQVYTDRRDALAECEEQLLECLRPLGVAELRIAGAEEEWDGFSSSDPADIMWGIDERA